MQAASREHRMERNMPRSIRSSLLGQNNSIHSSLSRDTSINEEAQTVNDDVNNEVPPSCMKQRKCSRGKRWDKERIATMGFRVVMCAMFIWLVVREWKGYNLEMQVLLLKKQLQSQEEQRKTSEALAPFVTYGLQDARVLTKEYTPSMITTGSKGSLGPWEAHEGPTSSDQLFYGLGPFEVAGKKILGIRVPEAGVYDVRATVLFFNSAPINIAGIRIFRNDVIPKMASHSMVAQSPGSQFSPCNLFIRLNLEADDIVDLYSAYEGRAVHRNFTTITVLKIS